MATTVTFACLVCTILVTLFGPGDLTRVGTLQNQTWQERVDSYYIWSSGTFYLDIYEVNLGVYTRRNPMRQESGKLGVKTKQ